MSGANLMNSFLIGQTSLMDVITNLSLTANLKICLDAGTLDSYTSGTSWLDLSGNGYDFTFGTAAGAGSDDPTFNGVAGNLTSAEYMSYDGGDFFEYDTTPEAWMETLHKNNAVFTIIHWFYKVSDSNIRSHVGTLNSGGTGMDFEHSAGDRITIAIFDDAGNATVLDVTADVGSAISNDSWHFVAVSLDEPTGAGGSFFYLDGAIAQVSSSDKFDATYSSPSTSGSNEMQIGAGGFNNQNFISGTRSAELAIWQGTALTEANLDAIYANTLARFA